MYTPDMRRQGPLTMRHMLIASLVVILVNAQLCWWVVYVLRENRQRLDMERAELLRTADHMRDRQLVALARAGAKVEHQPRLDGIDLNPVIEGKQNRRPPMGFWHGHTGWESTWSDRNKNQIRNIKNIDGNFTYGGGSINHDIFVI